MIGYHRNRLGILPFIIPSVWTIKFQLLSFNLTYLRGSKKKKNGIAPRSIYDNNKHEHWLGKILITILKLKRMRFLAINNLKKKITQTPTSSGKDVT